MPGKITGLPFRLVLVVGEQRAWSSPASAIGADPSKSRTTIVSVVMPFGHGPLSTVQTRMLSPTVRSIKALFGSLGDTTVAVPLTTLQVPMAGKVTGLPARSVPVAGVHNSWSGPASATGLLAS